MPEVETIELLWRLLPVALLVPFITFFLGRLGSNKERKLEYRTFFQATEMKAHFHLADNRFVRDGSKHLLPSHFKTSMEWLEEMTKNPEATINSFPRIDYVELGTFGKSILIACNIKIKVNDFSNNKDYEVKVSIPILEKEEEIFIPLTILDSEGKANEIFRKEIKIKYTTQAGEKLLYKSVRKVNKAGDIVATEKHSTKFLWFFYFPISSISGEDPVWTILQGRDKK